MPPPQAVFLNIFIRRGEAVFLSSDSVDFLPNIFTFQTNNWFENRRIISATYCVHRHKKNTHIIVKPIHLSLHSESKTLKYYRKL